MAGRSGARSMFIQMDDSVSPYLLRANRTIEEACHSINSFADGDHSACRDCDLRLVCRPPSVRSAVTHRR